MTPQKPLAPQKPLPPQEQQAPTLQRPQNALVFGEYQVLEEVGSGGMGVVYKARKWTEPASEAFYALKRIKAEDAQEVARFMTEAQALSALKHPNIIRFHELIYKETQSYLVMEYLEGDSLETLVSLAATRRGLSSPLALSLAAQVARALTAVHQAGLAHRDLKPRNIMTTRPAPELFQTGQGTLKLIDFGIAFAAERTRAQLTTTGAFMGTLLYAAPEQLELLLAPQEPPSLSAEDRLTQAQQADLFALGLLLYTLLVGAPLYRAPGKTSSILEELRALRTLQQEGLETLKKEVPTAVRAAGVEDLLRRLLLERPTARPEAAAVVAALETVLLSLGVPLPEAHALETTHRSGRGWKAPAHSGPQSLVSSDGLERPWEASAERPAWGESGHYNPELSSERPAWGVTDEVGGHRADEPRQNTGESSGQPPSAEVKKADATPAEGPDSAVARQTVSVVVSEYPLVPVLSGTLVSADSRPVPTKSPSSSLRTGLVLVGLVGLLGLGVQRFWPGSSSQAESSSQPESTPATQGGTSSTGSVPPVAIAPVPPKPEAPSQAAPTQPSRLEPAVRPTQVPLVALKPEPSRSEPEPSRTEPEPSRTEHEPSRRGPGAFATPAPAAHFEQRPSGAPSQGAGVNVEPRSPQTALELEPPPVPRYAWPVSARYRGELELLGGGMAARIHPQGTAPVQAVTASRVKSVGQESAFGRILHCVQLEDSDERFSMQVCGLDAQTLPREGQLFAQGEEVARSEGDLPVYVKLFQRVRGKPQPLNLQETFPTGP